MYICSLNNRPETGTPVHNPIPKLNILHNMKTKPNITHYLARTAMTLIAVLTTATAWADFGGRCGTNTWYKYTNSTHMLMIYIDTEGTTGEMTNYFSDDDVPWKSVRAIIKKVIVDEGVTHIGNYAFYGCTALTDVTLASTVTSIGDNAFHGCSSLPSIRIPDGLARIGNAAFSGCELLGNITLPTTMVSIEDFAFENCKAMTSFSFPSGVTGIGVSVFKGCTGLKTVSLPDGVTSIGLSAFAGCTQLEEINIPSSVVSIGNEAFNACSSLTSVNIPNSVESIGDAAFLGCTSLQSVNIPNSVENIGERAFERCTSLTSVNIPNSVESIGNSTFLGCTSLTEIAIPYGVTGIGAGAFKGCTGLTSVSIPSSVGIIDDAFMGCTSLTSVYCYAANPPSIWNSAFAGNASGRKIYVPKASLDDYKDNWKDYQDDIVGVPVYVLTLVISPDETSGTATISTTLAAKGDKVELTATPLEGYYFVWWGVTGGAVLANPMSTHTTLTMPNTNVTVTAKFRSTEDNPYTHTLFLDNNDDDPFGQQQIFSRIKSCILPARTRNGYYFLGWATSPTGDPAFQAGDTIWLEEDLTLYASWLPNPVQLEYNAANTATINKLNQLGAIDVQLNEYELYNDGDWNTLCLPFDVKDGDDTDAVTFTGTPLEGATVKELDTDTKWSMDNGQWTISESGHQTGFDSSDGTLYLFFKSAYTIEAGKPYIIKWDVSGPGQSSTLYNPTFSSVNVANNALQTITSQDGKVSFQGIYNQSTLNSNDKNNLYLGAENTLYYPSTDLMLGAFRAYFKLTDISVGDIDTSNGINAFVVNIDEEASAIDHLPFTIDHSADVWYSIDGRRLSAKPTARGVYIHNGRKWVIK